MYHNINELEVFSYESSKNNRSLNSDEVWNKIINLTKHHPVLPTTLIDKTAIKNVGDSDLVN